MHGNERSCEHLEHFQTTHVPQSDLRGKRRNTHRGLMQREDYLFFSGERFPFAALVHVSLPRLPQLILCPSLASSTLWLASGRVCFCHK